MSDWMARAKGLFGQAQAEPEPEPVEIACPCGGSLEAMRRESFQRVLCKNCGEAFFLLPLDVYPRPVMKVRIVPGPRRKAAAETPKPNETQAPATTAIPTRPLIDSRAVWNSIRQRIARQFTALRMVVVSLLLVIALTGWWQWQRSAQASAEITFKQAWDAGQAAVAKQDWLAAQSEFDRVAKAANVLERSDSQAEEARQWQREFTAVNWLLTNSLAELFDDLRTRRQKETTAAAESAFPGLFSGRWIVLQTEMTPATKPSDSIDWEQPLLFETEGLLLVGQFPAFAKVPPPQVDASGPAAETREVIFAAKLDSVRWDAARSLWVVRLSGSSCFLWSHYDALLAAGLPPDELRSELQLKSLLSEQSKWIGISQ